ncbi:hypothetical protein ACGF3G_48330 [Streptomyces sp. NPDC048179]|uniref:hypothetical protein n=1 Tax=Streptomyces sp. NPDC048179 TaxID=3365506 RepID=UPI0037194D95
MASGELGKGRHSEVDGVPGAGEADFESLDLAEPAFPLGFGDPVEEVVADLCQRGALGGIGAEY